MTFYIRFYDVDGHIEIKAASLEDAEKIAELLGIHGGIGWVERGISYGDNHES